MQKNNRLKKISFRQYSKNLFWFFRRLWMILVDAENGWQQVATDKPCRIRVFMYSGIGLCAFFAFLGALLNGLTLATAFAQMFLNIGILIGTFYFAFAVSDYVSRRYLKQEISKTVSYSLVCYSFSAIFPIRMLLSIFTDLYFIQVLQLYTFYLMWVGYGKLVDKGTNREAYLVIITIILLALPYVIKKICQWILPNFPF